MLSFYNISERLIILEEKVGGYVAQSVRFRAYIRRLFMRSILAFIALMLISYAVFVVFYYEI